MNHRLTVFFVAGIDDFADEEMVVAAFIDVAQLAFQEAERMFQDWDAGLLLLGRDALKRILAGGEAFSEMRQHVLLSGVQDIEDKLLRALNDFLDRPPLFNRYRDHRRLETGLLNPRGEHGARLIFE